MTRILITGAGGAIGKCLSEYFIKYTEFELVLNYFSETEIPLKVKDENIKIVVGDISNEKVLKEVFDDIDVLIHLASSVNPMAFSGKWSEAFSFGSNSTFAVLDYIKEYKKPLHILFPSSGGTVYNDSQNSHTEDELVFGESPYGIQKIMFENYFKLLCTLNKNITCNILRISNIYGLNVGEGRKQGFIDVAIHKILNQEPVEVWVPVETSRDYIFKDDVLEVFKLAINYKNGFEIFNVGNGVAVTIKEILDILETHFCDNLKIEYKNPDFSTYFPLKNLLDIMKIRNVLEWQLKFDINSGINKIVQEIKVNK